MYMLRHSIDCRIYSILCCLPWSGDKEERRHDIAIEMALPLTIANEIRCISHVRRHWPTRCGYPSYVGRQAMIRRTLQMF